MWKRWRGRGVRWEFGGSATVVLSRITATLVPSGTSAVSRVKRRVYGARDSAAVQIHSKRSAGPL
jgi:hypothetical protein